MRIERKTYTLLLGVDKCNTAHYFNSLELIEATQSVINLFYLFRDKYKIPNSKKRDSVLLGENASWFNFKNYLNGIKTLSILNKEEESLLFIYMIGHSSQFKEQSDNSFFCFHDQMVKRGEILTELGKIGEGFKIVWVLDTCYAESFWEDSTESFKEESFPLFLDSMPSSYISKEAIRTMYDRMLLETYNEIEINSEILFIPTAFKFKASSNDGDFEMSYFADVLFQTSLEWIIKKKKGNYYEFLDEIIKCTSISCTEEDRIELPGPKIMGIETDFFKTKNFLYINN